MRRAAAILGLLWCASACSGAGQGGAAPLRTTPPAEERRDAAEAESVGAPVSAPFEAGEALLAEEGLRGAFVVRAAGSESFLVAGAELAAERLSPASTFKIPNALIALETGVAPDESFALPWDGVERAFDGWNGDHDLASAMEGSVVWFFQELARRVGLERMGEWVARLRYGNGEIGERVDSFWLEGPLAISALEQIAFVERLLRGELPVSERSARIVRRIVPTRQAGAAVLHAKTGTHLDEERCHCWLVGWVEQDGQVSASFALLLLGDAGDVRRLTDARWDVAIRLLERAGLVAR